jgi:hypothetical protein
LPEHKKKRLTQPTILTHTRYIGFARKPVRDDWESALITGLPEPQSDYELQRDKRWIDARK